MKKISLLIVAFIFTFALTSCNEGGSSSSSENISVNDTSIESISNEIISSEDYTSEIVPLPDLNYLFDYLKKLDNYTLEINDEIFDVVTTYEFTENAMYYTPSKKAHGGEELGYAQSKNNEVFSFIINNDELVVGQAIKDNFGKPYTSLYDQVAISLRDLDLDNLPEYSTDNKYVIDAEADPYNFLVFVALAGYYDQFAIPYLSLSIEVTGYDSFVSTIHFDTGDPSTTGDITMTIKDINTTSIPYIDEYIENNGGPLVDNSSEIIEYLQDVKDSKNYKVEVKSDTTHFVDIYNEDYYFSKDMVDETNSSGYVLLEDSYIYKFNKVGSSIELNGEIYYETDNHNDIWGNIIAKRSFAALNLSTAQFKLNYSSSGYVLENSYSALSILLARCHVLDISGFAPVDVENDKVTFTLENDVLRYEYVSQSHGTYIVEISSIGSASDGEIEAFIEEYNNKEEVVLDVLATFKYLKDNHNYTVKYKENFSYTSNNVLKNEDCEIYFTNNHYYFASEERNTYYGFYKDETDAFKYVVNDNVITKEKDLSDLDLTKNYKSFANFDENKFAYSENNDGSYKVENDEFISLLASIINSNTTNFLTYIASVNITMSEGTISIKGSTLMYGSFTFEILNVGSTTLEDIVL